VGMAFNFSVDFEFQIGILSAYAFVAKRQGSLSVREMTAGSNPAKGKSECRVIQASRALTQGHVHKSPNLSMALFLCGGSDPSKLS
jgi:hypothetical protein